MITIREKDIEVFTTAISGFRDFYDENDKRIHDISEEDYDKALIFLDNFNKVKTVEDIKKAIPVNVPYSLEIMDNTLVLTWSVNKYVYGKMLWNFEIIYAPVS